MIDFALLLSFTVFILTRADWAAYATAILFWIWVIKSLFDEGGSGSWASLLRIIGAFLLVWLGLGVVWNTKVPMAVIASCSMAPTVDKGSLIFVANYGIPDIPTIHMSEKKVNALYGKSWIYYKGHNYTSDVSFLADCYKKPEGPGCHLLWEVREEHRGPFVFLYEPCKRGNKTILCITHLKYGNATYPMYKGWPIAFKTRPDDALSTLQFIVHRAVLRIRTPNHTYYMTKGDNVEVPDILGGGVRKNHLVDEERVFGIVFMEIPYIGYLRMIPFGLIGGESPCLNYLR